MRKAGSISPGGSIPRRSYPWPTSECALWLLDVDVMASCKLLVSPLYGTVCIRSRLPLAWNLCSLSSEERFCAVYFEARHTRSPEPLGVYPRLEPKATFPNLSHRLMRGLCTGHTQSIMSRGANYGWFTWGLGFRGFRV